MDGIFSLTESCVALYLPPLLLVYFSLAQSSLSNLAVLVQQRRTPNNIKDVLSHGYNQNGDIICSSWFSSFLYIKSYTYTAPSLTHSISSSLPSIICHSSPSVKSLLCYYLHSPSSLLACSAFKKPGREWGGGFRTKKLPCVAADAELGMIWMLFSSEMHVLCCVHCWFRVFIVALLFWS